MNATTKISEPTGLELLRKPFPPNAISKLPKPTKRQTDEVKADFKKGIRCPLCGAWHHPDVVHLDYVGHAALTDRLLDCDPQWNWEPIAFDERGRPAFDDNGGLWIKLTVCGVTRYGYGNAEGKRGGDAIKEIIGDALRNAAMRFGAALDLWHKGTLHPDPDGPDQTEKEAQSEPLQFDAAGCRDRLLKKLKTRKSRADLERMWAEEKDARIDLKTNDEPKYNEFVSAFKKRGDEVDAKTSRAPVDDEIPF